MSDSEAHKNNDIVVVDDDTLTLELVKRNLRNTDLRLKCFDDEIRGLSYLRNHTTRILIVDQRMPRLDGLDLLQQLIETTDVVPIQMYLCSIVPLSDDICARAQLFGARPLLKDTLRSKEALLALLTKSYPKTVLDSGV